MREEADLYPVTSIQSLLKKKKNPAVAHAIISSSEALLQNTEVTASFHWLYAQIQWTHIGTSVCASLIIFQGWFLEIALVNFEPFVCIAKLSSE